MVFMAWLCEINRRGRRVLSSLRIFITGTSIYVIAKSSRLVTTIKKSSIFQFSLRYELLSITNPKAIVFNRDSMQNRNVNIMSNTLDKVSYYFTFSVYESNTSFILLNIIKTNITLSKFGFITILYIIYLK